MRARATCAHAVALRRSASLAPDIILLDLGLPDMTGHEVVNRLRRQARYATTILVPLTGYDTPEAGPVDRDRLQQPCLQIRQSGRVGLAPGGAIGCGDARQRGLRQITPKAGIHIVVGAKNG